MGPRRTALSLVFACLLLSSCGGDAEAPRPNPVLVIGVDGLEPSIVDDLIQAGRMPNLARLAERGVLGRLATLDPTYSPVIWTTVATGQPMDAHGITDFLSEPEGVPFTSNCRKVPALWNIVSDHGLSVDSVGWWVSWPAEAVRGRMVASYAAAAQARIVWKPNVWESLPDQTWPPSLQEEIAPLVTWSSDREALLDEFWQVFDRPERPMGDTESRCVNDLVWTFAGDRSFSAIGEYFLETPPLADLVLVYMAMPDVAGHRFWRYHQPEDFEYEVPAEDLEDFGDFLNRSYAEIDRRIGRLLERAPEGANVLVLSDHGMHADPMFQDAEHADSIGSGHHQLRPHGVLAAAGPQIKRRGNLLADEDASILGHVLSVAPTVLRMLELPVPEHWPVVKQGHNPLDDALIDDGWRSEHPRRTAPNRDADFRPASPPRVPASGMDERFIEFLDDLGYVDVPRRR